MKKALIYASVASMIQQFNMENIYLLLKQGYEVDVACNMESGSTISQEKVAEMKRNLKSMNVNIYHIPIPRNVTAFSDIFRSVSITKKIMNERKYDLVHCHSPIGGIICRLANRFCKNYKKTKMIYTAHGFHFYKGAPLKNWLIYYPVEKLCAHFTDILITINKEDYALAKRKLKAKQIEYVPGVGIDTERFSECVINKAEKRKELAIPEDAMLLLSVGELNKNKNHETVIKALAKLHNPDIHYLIAGKGKLEDYLNDLIKSLNLENNVKLIGYRTDIAELYKAADICVFPSIREGLGLAAIEGMAAGLPLIVADNRGTRDFCQNNINGLVCNTFSSDEFADAINKLWNDTSLRRKMGNENLNAAGNFDIKKVNSIMNKIYFNSCKKGEECE